MSSVNESGDGCLATSIIGAIGIIAAIVICGASNTLITVLLIILFVCIPLSIIEISEEKKQRRRLQEKYKGERTGRKSRLDIINDEDESGAGCLAKSIVVAVGCIVIIVSTRASIPSIIALLIPLAGILLSIRIISIEKEQRRTQKEFEDRLREDEERQREMKRLIEQIRQTDPDYEFEFPSDFAKIITEPQEDMTSSEDYEDYEDYGNIYIYSLTQRPRDCQEILMLRPAIPRTGQGWCN